MAVQSTSGESSGIGTDFNRAAELHSVTVIIPCAGEISESLVPLVGRSSSALIPLNGKPVIFHTLSYLIQLGFRRFVVPVRRHDTPLKSLLLNVFGSVAQFTFPVPDVDGDLGYTVLVAGNSVETTRALIVLGDTFFQFPDLKLASATEDFLLVHEITDPYRWCIAEADSDGKADEFIEKDPHYTGPGSALIGVYGIADWELFTQSLERQWTAHKESPKPRLPLSEALRDYNHERPFSLVRVEEWFDCGHADNLMQSRRTLLQKRAFNELTFDHVCSTVVKKSTDLAKFLDEINYYLLLPDQLKIFFPRVVTASTEPIEPYLQLEFYGYTTLAELLLFETLDSRIWKQVFVHLSEIASRFQQFRAPYRTEPFESMYVKRVEERLDKLAGMSSALGQLVNAPTITLNGKTLRGFSDVWRELQPAVRRLARPEDFAVIHGDMCFSNILYDLGGRVCKFIDPRGSFGEKGIYGDVKYDIAKLYHSIDGAYDFIVNDLFSLKQSGTEIELRLFTGESLPHLRQSFEETFFDRFDKNEIQLIEALLFLTMGVFHYDSANRQIAMFATGLRLLNTVAENLKG